MINAAEANRATNDEKMKALHYAWDWVRTQFPKIEKEIKKAIENGQFHTSCTWYQETFFDLGFSQFDAAEAMNFLTYDYGYKVFAIPYASAAMELVVYINWKEA